MPSPFPGMDPYLETPEFWPEVHSRLIVGIADALAPILRPKYRVAVEKRVYWSQENGGDILVGIPDASVFRPRGTVEDRSATTLLPVEYRQPTEVTLPTEIEVKESFLEIREVSSGQVVTAIEILSPKNKQAGEGYLAYERKRQQILASQTHLIEIDFLRQGKRPEFGAVNEGFDYYILVSRSNDRPRAAFYSFTIEERIPLILVPLMMGEEEPLLDLQMVFTGVYDRAGFDLAIDY